MKRREGPQVPARVLLAVAVGTVAGELLLLLLALEGEGGAVAVRTSFEHDGKKKKRKGTPKKNASKCSGCLVVMKYASSELLNEWHQRKPKNKILLKIGKNIGTHSTEETGSENQCKLIEMPPSANVKTCTSVRK